MWEAGRVWLRVGPSKPPPRAPREVEFELSFEALESLFQSSPSGTDTVEPKPGGFRGGRCLKVSTGTMLGTGWALLGPWQLKSPPLPRTPRNRGSHPAAKAAQTQVSAATHVQGVAEATQHGAACKAASKATEAAMAAIHHGELVTLQMLLDQQHAGHQLGHRKNRLRAGAR